MARKSTTTKPVAEKEFPVAKKVSSSKEDKYISKKYPMWHPFQEKLIPLGPPGVALKLDSFLECQLKAGLVEKL